MKRSLRSSGLHTLRSVLVPASLLAALVLAGCNAETISQVPARALKPLSQDMLAELQQKNMPTDSPILVRIFKEEAELEVWKKDASGHFAHLKTYPICRWSGELGPKVKEGDRQAPEGFYQITPGLMNPNSNYYLAFNLGFPNTYDKANDRTGAFLMVHGDCSSRGCYAMTDEQIGEIFALGRESFQGGQKSFQVQAYPFRMTALNMARHRNSPNMAFWRMIKRGYDLFEVTHDEPHVDVCNKQYVFNAESPNGAPLHFNPRGQCPAYQLNPEVADALQAREAEQNQQFADYVARGTPTVPVKTGTDGGMHPTFLAKLGQKNLLAGMFEPKIIGAQPGSVGNNVNPPREADVVTASLGASESPAPTTASYSPPTPDNSQVRSRAVASSGPNMLDRVGSFLGFNKSEPAAPPPSTEKVPLPPRPKAIASFRPSIVAHAQAAPTHPQQRVAEAPAAPQPQQQPAPAAMPTPASVPSSGVISGAVAPMQAASFDARWNATR